MNDLIDSLVDEDPLMFVGTVSTWAESSLYAKHHESRQAIPISMERDAN